MLIFCRRCGNPAFAARALADFAGKGIQLLRRRCRRPNTFYPPSVQAAFAACGPVTGDPADDACSLVEDPGAIGDGVLQLASGTLTYEGEPNWYADFDDIEELQSLHRWNWLLTTVSEANSEKPLQIATALMRSWLRQFGLPKPRLDRAWNTYSTGERIANCGLFWLLHRGTADSLPRDLRAALSKMGRHVSRNIEYHGQEATGNHPFNNARALFVAGQLLGDAPQSELAFAILRERAEALLTPDGFLREGSAHYHFLFTRWLLEIRWFAQVTAHAGVARWAEPLAARLVERCWFFLVRRSDGCWEMPLFGDVSPDFPPSWLLSLPWSPLAISAWQPQPLPAPPAGRGWKDLWTSTSSPAPTPRAGGVLNDNQTFPRSHWHRIDAHAMTLIIHAEVDPGVRFASHRHGDLGGFALFVDGVPIFVDPGRLNYRFDDPLGLYGLAGHSHNSVLLDGVEAQAALALRRLPAFYRENQAEVSIVRQGGKTEVILRHTGFARLPGDRIVHTRRWILGPKCLRIVDELEGSSQRQIETRFHCAPEAATGLDENGVILSWASGRKARLDREPADGVARCVIARERISPSPAGWYCRQYGVRQPCATVIFSQGARLPARNTYCFEFN